MKKALFIGLYFLEHFPKKYSKRHLVKNLGKHYPEISRTKFLFAINYLYYNNFIVPSENGKLILSPLGKDLLKQMQTSENFSVPEDEIFIFYYDFRLLDTLLSLRRAKGIPETLLPDEILEKISREFPDSKQEIKRMCPKIPGSFCEKILLAVCKRKMEWKAEYAKKLRLNYRMQVVLDELKKGYSLHTIHKRLNIHPEILAHYIEIFLLKEVFSIEELGDFSLYPSRFRKILIYFYDSRETSIANAVRQLKEPPDVVRIGRAWFFLLARKFKNQKILIPYNGNFTLLSL